MQAGTTQADYTGLGARAWEGYASDPDPKLHPDLPMWLAAAKMLGDPILDVGCATGRVLIPLLEAGHTVDGIDPSEDALAICRTKLNDRGWTATLAAQMMQTLDMPRQYRAIFVPCGTIQIVLTPDEQTEALARLFAHLQTGGTLLMTLYNESKGVSESDIGNWKTRSRRPQTDGTELEKAAIIHAWDPEANILTQQVRYRLYRDGDVVQEETCQADERWYTVPELTGMPEQAGFVVERVTGNYSDAPADDSHYVYTFWARKVQ